MSSLPPDLITLSRLLDQALDLHPAEVDAWLVTLPAEHTHLRPRLKTMLDAHIVKGQPDFLADGPRLEGGTADGTVASTGDRIGPYRLVREIGHGGMGTVWLAQRDDGSYKRQVALKLPRLAWGGGLAQRMARERDIGALLEHPNIARLYDAGVDGMGRPYLALEYIDGQPLDRWCEARSLSIRDRLRLFVQIARAVAYAHGRLVVHRDLKPSNILVTADGQAHLLDFGIAKLLDEAAAGGEQITQEQGRVMTPRYASPEQIRGQAVTVASDVYSLGVVLHELLTGRLPYESERRTHTIEQAMFDEALPLPSNRVTDKASAKHLRGDVDAILTKVLKADPGLRYATADALAEDVERHLMGERVVAQVDSFAYRAGKVLKRHRAVFATGGVLGVALVAFSIFALVQANRALRSAERERMVKEFVSDIFRTSSRSDGGTVGTGRSSSDLLVERGAHMIESRFPGQPELQAELFGVVSGVFAEMGAYKLAVDYSGKQLGALQALPTPPGARLEADVLMRFADALLNEDRLVEAETRARAAMSRAYDSELRKKLLVLLARIQLARGSVTQSEVTAAEARRISLRNGQSIADAWLEWLDAAAETRQNRMASGLTKRSKAVDIAMSVEGPASRTAAILRLDLGVLLVSNNRLKEAEVQIYAGLQALENAGATGAIRAAVSRAEIWGHMYAMQLVPLQELVRAVDRSRAVLASSSVAVPASLQASVDIAEGAAMVQAGDATNGRALLVNIPMLRAETESVYKLFALSGKEAPLHMLLGEHKRATSSLRELMHFRKLMGQENSSFAAVDYQRLVFNHLMAGDMASARAELDAAPVFKAVDSDPVSGHIYAQALTWERARLELMLGNEREALEQVGKLDDDDDRSYWDSTHALRAEIYCAAGRAKDGLTIMNEVIQARSRSAVVSDPILARHRAVAGTCAWRLGDRKLAEQMRAAAQSAFEAQAGVSAYFKWPLDRLAASLGKNQSPRIAAALRGGNGDDMVLR